MSRLLLLQHNSFVGKVRSLLPSARSPDTPGHTIAFKIVAASSSRYGVGMRARRVLDPYVLGRKLRLRSFRSVLIGKATIEAWVVRRRRLRGGIFFFFFMGSPFIDYFMERQCLLRTRSMPRPSKGPVFPSFQFLVKKAKLLLLLSPSLLSYWERWGRFCLFSFVSFLPSWPTQTHALSIPCYHIKTSCWFSFIRSTGLLVCRGNRQRISARQSRSISSSSSSSSSSISSSFSFRRCIPSYSFARQPSPRAFGTLFAPVFLPSGNKKRKGAKRVGGRRRRRH